MIRHILALVLARAIAALVLLQRCLHDPRALPAAVLSEVADVDPRKHAMSEEQIRLWSAHRAMGAGRQRVFA